MVEVTKESDALSGWPLENCALCRKPTAYWYGTGALNVALCPECAATAQPKSIPTKAQWIAKERALTPRPIWRS